MGGGELHLRTISERLVQRGHQVTVITQRVTSFAQTVDRTLRKSEIINGVHVRRLAPHYLVSNLIHTTMKLPGGYRLLRALMGTRRLANFPDSFLLGALVAAVRARPDLVVVENWALSGLVWQFTLLRHVRRVKLVGMPLFHTEVRWSHSPFLAEMVNRYDAMIALTEHERAFIRRQSGSDHPVYVVGAGVDPSAFAERHGARIRARYGLQGFPVVGYIGRILREKGVPQLLAAMDILWQSDHRIRLLLAGRLNHDITQLVAGLSREARSRIVLTGEFQDDEKPSLFDAIDVFVMPSLAESFGIVYLEAWLCRRPVIGAKTGAVACLITEGVDGLLADPADPSSLAAAIGSLLTDEERRHRLADAGYQKTLTRFTSDRIADQIENVYRSVVEAHAHIPGGP